MQLVSFLNWNVHLDPKNRRKEVIIQWPAAKSQSPVGAIIIRRAIRLAIARNICTNFLSQICISYLLICLLAITFVDAPSRLVAMIWRNLKNT